MNEEMENFSHLIREWAEGQSLAHSHSLSLCFFLSFCHSKNKHFKKYLANIKRQYFLSPSLSHTCISNSWHLCLSSSFSANASWSSSKALLSWNIKWTHSNHILIQTEKAVLHVTYLHTENWNRFIIHLLTDEPLLFSKYELATASSIFKATIAQKQNFI